MELSYREVSTILAALRYWQRDYERSGLAPDPSSYFENHEPLSLDEVDELCERINFGEGSLVVAPLVYDGEPYDYRVKAEKTGDEGIYDEMAVLIERISDGKSVGDVYFLIDQESGEPCVDITALGDGLGDHAIRAFPLRHPDEMVRRLDI